MLATLKILGRLPTIMHERKNLTNKLRKNGKIYI